MVYLLLEGADDSSAKSNKITKKAIPAQSEYGFSGKIKISRLEKMDCSIVNMPTHRQSRNEK